MPYKPTMNHSACLSSSQIIHTLTHTHTHLHTPTHTYSQCNKGIIISWSCVTQQSVLESAVRHLRLLAVTPKCSSECELWRQQPICCISENRWPITVKWPGGQGTYPLPLPSPSHSPLSPLLSAKGHLKLQGLRTARRVANQTLLRREQA